LKEVRSFVPQLTRREKNRPRAKRGLFNLMRQISYSLFGVLDSETVQFYNRKISHLEKEQAELIK
jgi:hypothetical protein